MFVCHVCSFACTFDTVIFAVVFVFFLSLLFALILHHLVEKKIFRQNDVQVTSNKSVRDNVKNVGNKANGNLFQAEATIEISSLFWLYHYCK